jgi:hypothetical protein
MVLLRNLAGIQAYREVRIASSVRNSLRGEITMYIVETIRIAINDQRGARSPKI